MAFNEVEHRAKRNAPAPADRVPVVGVSLVVVYTLAGVVIESGNAVILHALQPGGGVVIVACARLQAERRVVVGAYVVVVCGVAVFALGAAEHVARRFVARFFRGREVAHVSYCERAFVVETALCRGVDVEISRSQRHSGRLTYVVGAIRLTRYGSGERVF